jgi:hypothetical protein
MAETFDAMRSFVWLQRLFRAGLSGDLGPHFRVERLALLAEQTSAQVSPHRTLRWNVRPYEEERVLLYQLASTVAGLEGRARARAERCLTTAGIDPQQQWSEEDKLEQAVSRTLSKIRSLSDNEWDEACGVELSPSVLESVRLSSVLGNDRTAALLGDLDERITRISELRRLRTTLGIRSDEQIAFSQTSCGRL